MKAKYSQFWYDFICCFDQDFFERDATPEAAFERYWAEFEHDELLLLKKELKARLAFKGPDQELQRQYWPWDVVQIQPERGQMRRWFGELLKSLDRHLETRTDEGQI